jgi:uncharacterized protein with HEPN domain
MKVAGSTYDELVALRSKTVFERAKLLAASGDRSRLDMTAVHVLSLLERFPVLYRDAWSTPSNAASPFARDGFDVSDGWHGIIERLSAKLAADPSLHIDQLKEKWGRLTVYFEREEGVPRDLSLDAEMEAALDEAEGESERTCMVCGEPGAREKRGLWVTVLCEPCVQLFEISETCKSIAERLEGLDLASFSANEFARDTITMELLCLGHAAASQTPASRARLPGIDWERLEHFKDAAAVKTMPVDELWRFCIEEAPELGRKLR